MSDMKNKVTDRPGLIQIYYGDGKGKTTAALGQIVRAAGYGYRVLFYQFMKNNDSSERKILEQIREITCLKGPESVKFSFLMTQEEKAASRKYHEDMLTAIQEMLARERYDVVFLDEAVYTVAAGLLSEEHLIRFMEEKPEETELILTGNTPTGKMLALADYVTEIKKIKHPFDLGQPARRGIEK